MSEVLQERSEKEEEIREMHLRLEVVEDEQQKLIQLWIALTDAQAEASPLSRWGINRAKDINRKNHDKFYLEARKLYKNIQQEIFALPGTSRFLMADPLYITDGKTGTFFFGFNYPVRDSVIPIRFQSEAILATLGVENHFVAYNPKDDFPTILLPENYLILMRRELLDPDDDIHFFYASWKPQLTDSPQYVQFPKDLYSQIVWTTSKTRTFTYEDTWVIDKAPEIVKIISDR